jgi:hypothetical protein
MRARAPRTPTPDTRLHPTPPVNTSHIRPQALRHPCRARTLRIRIRPLRTTVTEIPTAGKDKKTASVVSGRRCSGVAQADS